MIMDALRSHYLGGARMTSDTGEVFYVRWYPAAPGAKHFPHFHAFGSEVWLSDQGDDFDGAGILSQPHDWRGKTYPAPPGQHFHGLPEWFLFGAPSAEWHKPAEGDVCGVPAITGDGDVEPSGSADITPSTTVPKLIIPKTTSVVLSGRVDNLDLGDGAAFRLRTATLVEITGLAGGEHGRLVILENAGPLACRLINESAFSTPTNRFTTPCTAPQLISPKTAVWLLYNVDDNRWRIVNTTLCMEQDGDILTVSSSEVHVLHTAGSAEGDVLTRVESEPGKIAWRPPAAPGGSGGRDLNYFRQVTNRYGDRWYTSTYGDWDNYGPAGPQSDFWFWQPFISPRGGRLSDMRVNKVAGGSESDLWSLAIYDSVSASDLYPHTLLVDMGVFDGAGGSEPPVGMPLVLSPDTLYWLAFWGVFPSGTLSLSCYTTPPMTTWPLLGKGSNFNPNTATVHLKGGRAFNGIWPATLMDGAVSPTDDSDQPIIGVKYDQ